MGSNGEKRFKVAVTGATGDLGRLVLPRLLADPRVEKVLAFDLEPPAQHPRLEHHRLNLTHHDAERELTDALLEAKPDVLYHLAFLWGSRTPGNLAHEIEVIGSMRVLDAAERSIMPKVIVPSLTVVYGPAADHPAMIREGAPLRGSSSRFVADKVEVEALVRSFRDRNPKTQVIVLRFAPILGPNVDNPATRFFSRGLVPTLLGYDPLWQAVHEDDAGAALHQALHADVSGEFNIASEGVLPLSAMIRHAGGRPVPLPGPLARATLRALNAYGGIGIPAALLDYIHYPWVSDSSRAKERLGFVPRHHARDAAATLRRS